MRLMSFALTTPQVLDQSKTVTRRIGWSTLTPGTLLQPVKKVMGRPKGQQIERLGPPIRVVSVRRERLKALVDDPAYGRREMVLEGFPAWEPQRFIDFLAKETSLPSTELTVTRIQFEYTAPAAGGFIITEGVRSYHWSKADDWKRALCGAQVMRTSIPKSDWGLRSGHLPETYCRRCANLKAEAEGATP